MGKSSNLSIGEHNELIKKASEIIDVLQPFKEVLAGSNAIKGLNVAIGSINELYRLNFAPTPINSSNEVIEKDTTEKTN